eukprot:7965685-Pyramimonas_sp.AAC.2
MEGRRIVDVLTNRREGRCGYAMAGDPGAKGVEGDFHQARMPLLCNYDDESARRFKRGDNMTLVMLYDTRSAKDSHRQHAIFRTYYLPEDGERPGYVTSMTVQSPSVVTGQVSPAVQ